MTAAGAGRAPAEGPAVSLRAVRKVFDSAVLAVVAVVPAVAGLVLALRGRNPEVLTVVPWWPVAALAGACLVIALAASLVPAGVLVRRRPADPPTWRAPGSRWRQRRSACVAVRAYCI